MHAVCSKPLQRGGGELTSRDTFKTRPLQPTKSWIYPREMLLVITPREMLLPLRFHCIQFHTNVVKLRIFVVRNANRRFAFLCAIFDVVENGRFALLPAIFDISGLASGEQQEQVWGRPQEVH